MIPVHVNYQIPYVSDSNNQPPVLGEVRAINGQLQVYNGSYFVSIHTTAWVDSIELGTVVEWAKQKMEQELREQALVENYPAFAKAKENYETIRKLVQNG